jgi:hypothetical protein
MVPRLRTIAILMLLAGLSLGVFTSRALRAFGTKDLLADQPTTSGQARIDQLVELYAREFDLDKVAEDKVRQELIRYDQQLGHLHWELRQANKDRFRKLYEDCARNVQQVLDGTREKR